MARDDGLEVEVDHQLAGLDPIADRASPDNRMTLDEENIAGEDHAVLRDVGEHVATRMGRADFAQADRFVADAAFERTLEGESRHRDVDAAKVERREDFREEAAR